MDRQFDYTQKILLAVEFADAPWRMEGMPATYARFKRLSIPDIVRAFDETQNLFTQLITGRKFQNVLEQHMGYWEKRVPGGKQCFVHYAIGTDDVITAAFNRLKGDGGAFTSLGIYHVEPQSSAYPFSFPFGNTPDHWHLGEHFSLTNDSIFWFNFFPEQPYLFEKTFAVWALFQMSQLKKRAENNQLVAWEGKDKLIAQGVSDFVQVNLNRFTSLSGFFQRRARSRQAHLHRRSRVYLVWHAAEQSVGAIPATLSQSRFIAGAAHRQKKRCRHPDLAQNWRGRPFALPTRGRYKDRGPWSVRRRSAVSAIGKIS
jgi:hypothetical protein